jgi:hypothetical protein
MGINKGAWESIQVSEYVMGVLIFLPIAILSWFPFMSEFQMRLLFNRAFSGGFRFHGFLLGERKAILSRDKNCSIIFFFFFSLAKSRKILSLFILFAFFLYIYFTVLIFNHVKFIEVTTLNGVSRFLFLV